MSPGALLVCLAARSLVDLELVADDRRIGRDRVVFADFIPNELVAAWSNTWIST